MKETASEEFPAPSPSSSSPQGSSTEAPCADETPRSDELEANGELEANSELDADGEMEVKQVTLCKRSGEVKVRSKKEGVLTAEKVASSMSHLGCFGLPHYHNLSLPSHNLSDISVLCNYIHLQKLELPHNKIRDLSCVSHMPYLVTLDASHNEISDFFEFHPPKNLKEVNFSHNQMTKMESLAAYMSLCKLELDYNCFTEISGLQECCKLSHLSLAHNSISRISGLDGLPLKHLCLRGNQLGRIEGLESLKNLQVLDLSMNHINSLSGLQNLHLLGSIDVEKNQISGIQECKHIHNLFLLRDLNLLGNPVQEQPDYRIAVVFLLQHLTVLDEGKVTAEEKVSSVNKYDPPLDVIAARGHMTLLLYQMMQPQVLYDSTLPSMDNPYPMLVLTGPQGCGKRELAHRLCQEFNEYFAYGVSHTTRRPYFGEENGVDYHFVSEEDFERMNQTGKFLQTLCHGDHNYGLSRDAIEDVAQEGLACCVHMELEGVFSLKNTYFEPRYILLIPTQVEKYVNHLKSRQLYTPAQIDAAVARIELYANTNRQRPGFFDNVIPCDDWEEAFQTLGQVMKEYLLLEEHEEREGNNNDNNNNGRVSPDSASPTSGQEPEEKLASPDLRSGAGAVASDPHTALDPLNPLYRSYLTKIQAELSTQRSPAELASIRRREQLVREAIVGKCPGVYSQLFNSSAQTATHDDPDTQNQGDISSGESRASSALSVPISAGALSGCVEPLDISVLGRSLETPKDHTASGQSPVPSHPVVSPSSDRRPGSNAKAVLPPIPAGRKTPVPPSPAPSPRLRTNPAIPEESSSNAVEQ